MPLRQTSFGLAFTPLRGIRLCPRGQQRQDLKRSRAVYPGTKDRHATENHDQDGQQPADDGYNHHHRGGGGWSGQSSGRSNHCGGGRYPPAAHGCAVNLASARPPMLQLNDRPRPTSVGAGLWRPGSSSGG